MSSVEAKARALALRVLGRSYREIAADIHTTLKESVSHQTVAEWCNEDSNLQAKATQAKLQRMFDRDTEIGVRAGELLDEMLPNLPPRDMVVAYGVNRDKTQGWLKILQDERKQSDELMALRMQIRARPVHEIKALALTLHEGPSEPLPPEPPSPQDIRRYHGLGEPNGTN